MKNMSIKATLAALLLGLGVSNSAMALDGEALFKNPAKGGCTACHGKDGKTTILPQYPKIAGQNEAYVLQQLKDIKSGARNNGMTAAMKGIMHLVNDEEMAAMAKYISTMAP
ncbi:cytochrome C [Solemya pervernicosa gill symbiont]|uniref:Cytochrome C n=2 Tax=Gammaproteobacteria incertae sedis TaxID=118884 RepID=A0A1T2LBI3_9GAMM|nr:c-type cytochrome [Candidatus Reidiella endopervernicosa]OOZ42362.1 cytochrome C [Solemya pervernicosa gill symbiont]QKQ25755.1 c-type cytochrome [Candidatus Reidiella endopervernicosa]